MALEANTDRPVKGAGQIQSFLVEDDVHIFKGAQVVANDAGYAEPATNAADKVLLGVAYEECDNTLEGHSQGGKSVRVIRRGTFLLTTADLVQADVGIKCYIEDDDEVDDAGTSTQGIVAGVVVEVESATQVWVDIGLGVDQGELSAAVNADSM
jgi:predicted RecA/RadA family phage recombinase